MTVAGMILGTIGVLCSALMWWGAYLDLTASTLPNASVTSPKVDADGLRYLSNRANMLRDFATGVSQGRIKEGQVVSLSSTTEGRQDTIEIDTREGVQTAPGFRLQLDATSSQQGDATVNGISGNLLMLAKAATKPSLPTTAALARDQRGSDWRGLLAIMEVPAAYAAERELDFKTADPYGWLITVTGDHVTLKDSQGSIKGEYTFAGDDLVANIQETREYEVQAPDDEVGLHGCRQNSAVSVDNARVFSTLWSHQEWHGKGGGSATSRAEVAELLAQKVGSYDCKTGECSAHLSLDFRGEVDGHYFRGLVYVPQPVPPPAPRADMAVVQAQMKKRYLDSTRIELVDLRCKGERFVSYRASPVECHGRDAKENGVSAEVTIDEEAQFSVEWGPIVPHAVEMSEVMQVMRDKYPKQTGRELVELSCKPSTGLVTHKDSPVHCSATDSAGYQLQPTVTIERNTRYTIFYGDYSNPEEPSTPSEPDDYQNPCGETYPYVWENGPGGLSCNNYPRPGGPKCYDPWFLWEGPDGLTCRRL